MTRMAKPGPASVSQTQLCYFSTVPLNKIQSNLHTGQRQFASCRWTILTRERVSGDDLLWETKLSAEGSHFIFVEVLQWFYYFSLGKNTYIILRQ